ncbi:protein KRTCAP2 homolog [Atheta coriaria]|uniref:protein KRTCAP2 homolog n=1 Tax=Dalotia coriaria TaxID=877792 RepID=UPI0031F3B2BE
MATSSGTSFVLSLISSILILSGMQMYKPWLNSSQLHTIFGGYLGSLFFMFLITACGNLESMTFGKSMQVKLFPEIGFCLTFSVICAGTVHRVSATTCLIFSIIALYYINKHSQKVYAAPPQVASVQSSKKRK